MPNLRTRAPRGERRGVGAAGRSGGSHGGALRGARLQRVPSPPATPGLDARARLAATRVYLVVTEAACRGPWERAVERTLSSGVVGVVQLREKTIDDREFARRARWLRSAADRVGALLIVNDRVALAAEAGADGVHVGEHDASPAAVRALVGADRLVGLSTHARDEVAAASDLDVDYVGLGPCFATSTKSLERAPQGPAIVESAAGATAKPVFPIGGITVHNVGRLIDAGARRVAVSSGILGTDDPSEAARRIADALARGPAPAVRADGLPVFGRRFDGDGRRTRPGSYAVLVNDAGLVGVIRTPRGTYLAGGGVDPGESVETALVREVREELGHEVGIVGRLGRAIEHVEADDGEPVVKDCVFFEARLGRRLEVEAEADHQLVWLDARDAVRQLAHASQAWAVARRGAG